MDQQADSSPGLIFVWLKKWDLKKKKYFQDSEEKEGGPNPSV